MIANGFDDDHVVFGLRHTRNRNRAHLPDPRDDDGKRTAVERVVAGIGAQVVVLPLASILDQGAVGTFAPALDSVGLARCPVPVGRRRSRRSSGKEQPVPEPDIADDAKPVANAALPYGAADGKCDAFVECRKNQFRFLEAQDLDECRVAYGVPAPVSAAQAG